MAMGKSVQFTQQDHVIDAYTLRGVPMYAIFQGAQLLTKYEGSDIDEGAELLSQFLQMLSGSAAIYTLAVYEEIAKGQRISIKTPYHGSFNFRFQDTTNFQQVSGLGAINSQLQKLSQEIEQLRRDRLQDEMDAADMPDEAQPDNALDKIAGFLSHPLVEKFMPVILGALQPKQAIPSAVAGDPGQAAQVPNLRPVYPQQAPDQFDAELYGGVAKISGVDSVVIGDQEISEKLLMAVCDMVTRFPECEPALMELARIAKEKPDKFKSILGYLKFL